MERGRLPWSTSEAAPMTQSSHGSRSIRTSARFASVGWRERSALMVAVRSAWCRSSGVHSFLTSWPGMREPCRPWSEAAPALGVRRRRPHPPLVRSTRFQLRMPQCFLYNVTASIEPCQVWSIVGARPVAPLSADKTRRGPSRVTRPLAVRDRLCSHRVRRRSRPRDRYGRKPEAGSGHRLGRRVALTTCPL